MMCKMSGINHQLADLLLQIEAELRHQALWEGSTPSAAALLSTTPFCADTLHFNQWLQWLFVPRMKQILEQSLPLPQQCDIHTYVEQQCHGNCEELLRLIKRFDELVVSGAEAERETKVRH